VLELLERRRDQVPLVVVDTPGQIEAFTWSASGSIITDALAGSFPTVIAYVLDCARSTNPTTFMSNMLYVCMAYHSFFYLEGAKKKFKMFQIHGWKNKLQKKQKNSVKIHLNFCLLYFVHRSPIFLYDTIKTKG
jgi:hypothetical protein